MSGLNYKQIVNAKKPDAYYLLSIAVSDRSKYKSKARELLNKMDISFKIIKAIFHAIHFQKYCLEKAKTKEQTRIYKNNLKYLELLRKKILHTDEAIKLCEDTLSSDDEKSIHSLIKQWLIENK